MEKLVLGRTVIAVLDLSEAFDTFNIGILLKIILETILLPIIKIWLGNYLSWRQTYVAGVVDEPKQQEHSRSTLSKAFL